MASEKNQTKTKIEAFLKIIFKRFQMGDVSDSAVVLAYYTLLSLFPILIILGSAARMIKGNPNAILAYLRPLMPSSIYTTLTPIIKAAFSVQHSGGSLAIGIVLVIWSASTAMAAFQRTVNRTYGVNHKQDYIMNHIISFLIMLSLVVLIIGLMLIQGFTQSFLKFIKPMLGISVNTVEIIGIVRLPLVVIVAFVLLTLLYYLVPTVKVHIKYTFLGSTISVIGLVLLSQAFSLILTYFFKDISLYKTLGTFIVIMLWLYFIGMVLLFGAVVNASVQEYCLGEIKSKAKTVPELIQNAAKNYHNKKTTNK